jgi:hypothetical protein
VKDRGRNDDRSRSSERSQNNQRSRKNERERIAHLAARIMVEDGVEDFGLAKRKAAHQAGVSNTHQLPGNDEIEKALHEYQQLYRADEQRDRLRELRETALRAMRELAAFNPYLTGSVLTGSAGKYADINLQVFTDNAKAVEIFLMERRMQYRVSESTLYCGDERLNVPVFTVDDDGVEIEIAVLTPMDLRAPLKTSPEGKAIERARLSAVEELLEAT